MSIYTCCFLTYSHVWKSSILTHVDQAAKANKQINKQANQILTCNSPLCDHHLLGSLLFSRHLSGFQNEVIKNAETNVLPTSNSVLTCSALCC